jgi:flagellar basal-body rod protein FlgB
VYAHNVANASTDGFVAKRVAFEEYLSAFATEAVSPGHDRMLRAEVEALRPAVKEGGLMLRREDSEVELDIEMARITENVIRYQALLEALSKRGALVRLAIDEGRS